MIRARFAILALGVAAAALNAPLTAAAPEAWRNYPVRPRPAKGAPNILLVMTDDVGFGASSTFGGPIPTPTFDALAQAGLRYTAFHTTAMCSPSRAALLTGRNHHAVGFGAIADVSIDEPGYTASIPKSAATIGRVLHDAGYDTAWFGKNHNTPGWELGPMGPFDRWPNGLGFDYFYGFNAAMTDQRSPTLTENRNPVRPPNGPDYYLDRDLDDHLIHWLEVQHAEDADRPFLAYLAPGTMHSPQQAPPDWIARFKGRFDQGWDAMREQTFARQKAMGIVPANARISPRPAAMPAWDSLTADQKRLYARMMEVGAAQLAHMDAQFGRVIDTLRRSGQLDNTLIIFIQGDNGASLETYQGSTNESRGFLNMWEDDSEMMGKLSVLGSAATAGQYPVGWAWAMNTPYPWGKQVASHLGGLRDGMVVSWPARIHQTGQFRTQFTHLIDIAPTLYEAAGVTPPIAVDGATQQPIDGISFAYSFDHADAPERHREQYFEMLGNRSFYRDGWLASTTPGAPPWKFAKIDPTGFGWELYDLRHDFTQSDNLAARYPAKLAELQQAFDEAAKRNHVYPLTSDLLGRSIDRSLRPDILPAHADRTFYPGDTRYPIGGWPALGIGWRSIASVRTQSGADEGPIFGQGTRFGGITLALDHGVPVLDYDPSGRPAERILLKASRPLPPGDHKITVAVEGATAPFRLALSVDGQEQASAPLPRIIRVRGDAYVGRPLIDATSGPPACTCTIASVEVAN
jgi:arylsulfatase